MAALNAVLFALKSESLIKIYPLSPVLLMIDLSSIFTVSKTVEFLYFEHRIPFILSAILVAFLILLTFA
jgi:hypothetical protein